jgi:hypothetical protein
MKTVTMCADCLQSYEVGTEHKCPLPPMPEPAGGLAEYQKLAAQVEQLKRDVELLLKIAGLKA